MDSTGKKTPPRNIIGNLRRFESIIASLGSGAKPDIIVPMPVKEKLASKIIKRTKLMLTNETPKIMLPIISSTIALMTPMTAPDMVFPTTIDADETGAANIRSKTPRAVSYTHLTLPTNREV